MSGKKKGGISKAFLMIWLIVSMPLYVSIALGEKKIYETSIHGSNNVDGYFRPTEEERITFQVISSLDAELVTIDNVGIFDGKFYSFNSGEEQGFCKKFSLPICEKVTDGANNKYKCTCIEDAYIEGETTIKLALYDKTGAKIDETTKRIMPDTLPPEITKFELKQVSEGINATIALNDYACEGCTGCSGIKKIEFYDDGALKKTLELDYASCNYAQNITTITGITGDKTRKICAKAFDRIHNGGADPEHESLTICKDFTTDYSAPDICPTGKFKITQGTSEINYISTGSPEFKGAVVFEIQEKKITELKVDYTGLNINPIYSDKNYPENYLDIKLNPESDCTKNQDTYTCKKELKIKPANNNPQIKITAIDDFGLKTEKSCGIELITDNDGPKTTFVGTENCDATRCYVKPGKNKIISRFEETGSGLSKELIYLDIGSLGETFAGKRYQVYECTGLSPSWECWGIANIQPKKFTSGDAKRISIVYPSTDDALNPVKGETSSNVIYDDLPPVLLGNISITTDISLDYFVHGDNLVISANLTDDSSGVEKAVVNVTSIVHDSNLIETLCTTKGTYYECLWNINSITGPKANAPLKFWFFDYAGNNLTVSGKIDVLETQEQNKSFWKIGQVKTYPKIDKLTTNLISHSIYSSISIIPDENPGNVEILNMGLDCPGSQLSSPFLDESPLLFNKYRNSKTPFIKFSLKQAEIPKEFESLNFTCSLNIISKRGLKIYPPETETFDVKIELFNQPLGVLDDNIKKEIYRVKNSDLVEQKGGASITKLRTTLDWMKKLCGTLQGIVNIATAINILVVEIKISTKPLPFLDAITEALKPINDITQASKFYITKILGWTCAVASCQLVQKALTTSGYKGSAEVLNFMFMNPERSIVSSIATLCIPGVIYNLEKARQVECKYASCLMNEVPNGEPLFVCTSMRAYDWCKYVYGQKWGWLPFVQAFNMLLETGAAALKNPVSLIFTLGTIACIAIPKAEKSAMCHIGDLINQVGQIYSFINNFNKGWAIQTDYCGQVFKDFDKKMSETSE